MNSIDVLNLEWTSSNSRDRLAATLVNNYLKLQKYCVHEGSVFDGYYLIDSLKPKILFMTNSIGAPENRDLMEYATNRGIKGVSLISEGNFPDDPKFHEEMIWGWNKKKILAEFFTIHWSERTRQIAIKNEPTLKDRIKVSGGVGFDNYFLCEKLSDKKTFLSKYKKEKYNRIVGVGCWDFGIFDPKDSRYEIFKGIYTPDQAKYFIEDGKKFNSAIEEVVKNNKDILFLIKHHPGTLLGDWASGTSLVSNFENVIVIKNELPIFECINLSDFWVIYESTTALEAWLLGKQTCLLNPSGGDFPRDRIHKGSPLFTCAEELSKAIEYFFKYENIPNFESLSQNRLDLIKDIIQWADGLNHVRAGNFIIDLLSDATNAPTLLPEKLDDRITRIKQHIKWLLSPYIFKIKNSTTPWNNRKNFDEMDLASFTFEKYREQVNFYHSKGLDLTKLRLIKGI